MLSLIQLMDLRSLLKCSSSVAHVYVYKRNLHSHEQICEIIPKVALGFKHLMFFVLEHVAHVRLYALATNSPHGAVPNYLNKAENYIRVCPRMGRWAAGLWQIVAIFFWGKTIIYKIVIDCADPTVSLDMTKLYNYQ